MDFFNLIIEKKLVFLIISLILNGLLFSVIGFLLWNLYSYECEVSNTNNLLSNNEVIVSDEKFYVDVKGEVKKPGVYEISNKSIINDVITLAGGFTKKAYTDNINLSKKVSNELVIYVYSETEFKKLNEEEKEVIIEECICEEYDITDCTNNGSSEIITNEETNTNDDNANNINNNEPIENDTKLININTASKDALMTLSGIGESKADAIIEYRNKTKFNSIEDIKNVSGIGDSAFEKIKDFITV